MAVEFRDLIIDANDLEKLVAFWQQVLGWERRETDDSEYVEIAPPDGAIPTIIFVPVPEPKQVKDRLHIDVSPSAGCEQAQELERLLALGARHVDIGQGDQSWIVLADPEGNEFCLLREPVGP
jgi:predicted enzyme related to lactoylglutathione lyase